MKFIKYAVGVKSILISGTFLFLLITSCEKTQSGPETKDTEEDQPGTIYSDIEYTSAGTSSSAARAGMFSTSIGSKAYFVSGVSTSPKQLPDSDIDIYDGETFQWTKTFLPQPQYMSRISESYSPFQVINEYVFYKKYVPMGVDGPSERIQFYNLLTQETRFITLAEARLVEAVAIAGDQVFISGGTYSVGSIPQPSQFASDLYDLKTQKTISLPVDSSFAITRAVGFGKKIYTTGLAYTGTVPDTSERIRVYDTEKASWSEMKLTGNTKADVICAVDGKIALGGSDKKLHFYDPQTAEFTEAAFPGGDELYGTFTVAGNLLIVLGISDVHVYNTRTGVWTRKQLENTRYDATVAVAKDLVVVAGGTDGADLNSPVTKVEFFKLKK